MSKPATYTVGVFGVALAALTACEQAAVDGPTVTVFQIDADQQGCWRLCQSDRDDALALTPEGEACDGNQAETECAFTSGFDSVFVIAEYDLVLDKQPVGPAILQFLFDETSLDTKLSRRVDPVKQLDGRAALFQARLPASSATTMRLLVGQDEFLTPTEAMPSAPPQFGVGFVGCDGECSFPAGVGTATIELTTPRVLGTSTLAVVQSVDGVPLVERTQSYDPDNQLPLRISLPVPNNPFEEWKIEGRIGQFVSAPLTAMIEPVEALELTVAQESSCDSVDFQLDLPRAVRGEWSEGCRSYNVLVRAANRPTVPVTVTTSAGTLGSGGTSQAVVLDDKGCGVVPLLLPAPLLAPSTVTLGAQAAGFPSVIREWQLERTPVVFGELFGPSGPVLVSDQGTAASEVTGNLIAPGDASLGSNRGVPLDVRVSSSTPMLPCGLALPDENIECDMEMVNGEGKGGCQLTDNEVSLGSDGTFSLALDASKCFAGQLVVDLWEVRIEEPEPGQCMRDLLAPSSSPELLDSIVVDYVVQ